MPPAPLPQSVIDTIDLYYRQRWQTLLAVDDLIEAVVNELKTRNLYDQTYIILTSDNGYHLGQFSMPWDKRQPYETDIRIPFIVVGPNVENKVVIEKPVALIDLAPTIFEWAKVDEPDWVDGQSIVSILNEKNDRNDVDVLLDPNQDEFCGERCSSGSENDKFERKLLIQYWGEGTPDTYNPECHYNRHDKLAVCIVTSLVSNIYVLFM